MLDVRRDNLPAHPVRLIGRDREVAAVQQRLLGAERGLLTLSGAGGCGKTSLALAVARESMAHFPEGVWLVDLAPLTDPELKTLAGNERIRTIQKLDEWKAAVAADAPRSELWWIILLGVLGLLVFEVAMTRRLVRSGHEFVDPELEMDLGVPVSGSGRAG